MRDAAEIRTIYTSEFGLNRPAGLSYVPQRNEFLVAGPGRTHTRLLRLNREAEARGSVRLPRLEEPGTLAFDAGHGRLRGLTADRLISIRASDLIDDQPSVTRTEAPALPIASARSTTFDAIGHRWFVLGREGIRVFSSTNPGRTRSSRLIPQGIDPAHFSAIAFNPSDRLLYAATSDQRLFALARSGEVRRVFDLRSLGLLRPTGIVFAPSSDRTDSRSRLNLFVADAGEGTTLGGVMEVTLEAAVAVEANVVAQHVQTIATSNFSPGAPDPAGIVYIADRDRLVICDSEVDETTGAGYHGVNLWQTTRTGAVLDTGTTLAFSNEPTGLGWDPATNALVVSDDDRDRITFIRPGGDGRWGTPDDVNTHMSTAPYGSTDAEDPKIDPATGHLFHIDGINTEVYEIDPVNGTFGDGNDIVTHFDVARYGARDVEGLAIDERRDTLLVGERTSHLIFEVTKSGELIRTIDADLPGMLNISGLASAPASNNSGQTNYWIVDRAVDNGADPRENDGKLFEITVPGTDAFPTISLTTPPNGSTVAGTMQLQANASDDNGVTQVEFRVDNTTIATDTSAPYTASWNTLGVGDGAHTVRAIATDTAGQSATATANVTVDNVDDPPTVTLTAPAEGSTVGGTVQMQANASDDVGVTQVEFRAGGTTIGTDTNAPFTASWDTTAAGGGLTTVTAIATDTSAKTTSDSNDVTVDNSPPTVAITSPADGATVSGTITIQADAADNTGVNSVQFFVDGASIGTDSTAADGWSLAWNTVGAGNGNHTLTARALDRGGNPTLSAPVPVAIENALVLDIPVTVSADDAEQKLTNNSVRTNSSDLELVVDKAATQLIGLRYQGITLPRGATITNAYIQFQAAKTNSEATSLNLRAQAADDAPVFTTATSNLSSRPLTTASVPWTPAAWTQVNQRGLPQRSTNISPVLQEIVDRVGWSPGNSMVFIINGTGLRRAHAFDGGAAAAPSLHIEYANLAGP